MKSALTLFLFPLFLTGVFGDVESVYVMVGDSVTLNTDTKLQSNEGIEWKFRDASIASINRGSSSKMLVKFQTDGEFKGRLQLDNQTGDLKIMKIRITDSGPFTLEIRRTEVSSKTFNLSVSGVDEVKSVSVTVGYSVTLNSRTNIQRDDVIQWRFADLNSPIAEHNRKTRIFSTYDGPDEIFRHRLQLDYLTGSLTIRNITKQHSGLYEAGIRESSGYTIHQSYSVTLSGEIKSAALSVMKGDSVTLHTDLTEIHRDDLMLWMFEDSVIAEIIKAQNQFSTSVVPDGRFRDRMKLDHQTGSLTITDTRTEDSGLYELKISSSRFTINKRFPVTVSGLSAGAKAGIVVGLLLACAAAAAAGVIYYRRKNSELIEWFYKERILSAVEGEPVTLNPYDTDVHKDNKLVWIFRSSCIAKRNSGDESFTLHDDAPDGRFNGRLKLNDQTGSLTITHTRTTDTGVYELMIFRAGKSSIKRFNVSVFACVAKTSVIKPVPVKEGESVTLESAVTAIQKDDEILWTCGLYTPLAEITRETKKISPLADKIFEGRLKLNHQTGSLIINKTKPTDAGIYMLRITGEGNIKTGLFRVSVSENNPEEKSVTNPTVNRNNSENVPLRSVETSPDSRL